VTLTQRADGRLDVFGGKPGSAQARLRARGRRAPDLGHRAPDAARAQLTPETRGWNRSPAQPAVAFEPSALTQGESCRDPIGRIQALVGATLDPGFARRWIAEVGGPLGCSHILTLGQLFASTVAWALSRDHDRAPGPRRRALPATVIDTASSGTSTRCSSRTCTRPCPDGATDRGLGEERDPRLAGSRCPEYAARIEARARRTWRFGCAGATARPRQALLGQKLASGAGAGAAATTDAAVARRAENLTPGCISAWRRPERWPRRWPERDRGGPDSCFMWRRGGALDLAREEERRAGTQPLLPS
jgi:hypothetical protein